MKGDRPRPVPFWGFQVFTVAQFVVWALLLVFLGEAARVFVKGAYRSWKTARRTRREAIEEIREIHDERIRRMMDGE